ncbi:replication initiation factor [Stanieria cyanosphaera PCC 7437]|uniref:Replication initiation factor n=1 Tax=Stanieria cyanosphaera (strain ATCC 29371 / PCC 7437) TaxID=111780 RepID=K9XTU5_STAC7|nr:replication initiation factor domain-containing protein [Stanieria cyanosphaera]AFZ35072.1 replication initiation factor [Stanieria cyanosphaera PCC 7437]
MSSPKGIAGGFNKIASKDFENSSNTYDVAIDIKGSYLANLTPIEQYNLVSYLARVEGCKIGRFDLAIDDYSYQKIPLEEMKKAYKEGNNFGFKHHWDTGLNENGEIKGSRTEYFGGRTSDKKVRVYSHENKCMRFEAQLRGKQAESAIQNLTSLTRTTESDEEWNLIIQKTLGGIAVGIIDFRDKNKLKNLGKASRDKTKRLPFWQQFIDEVGSVIKLKPTTNKVKNEALESKTKWFNKYAIKTLAQLALVYGDEYVLESIKQGKASLTPKDHKEIEYWKSEINS